MKLVTQSLSKNKFNQLIKKLSSMCLVLLFAMNAFANEKHPRVAELEDKYKTDTIRYLEGRFPGLPFSVIISIDPLRDKSQQGYDLKGEVLPYYALDEEVIKDVWDDPTATLYTLSQRVKKVSVEIQIPESIVDEEYLEIKDTVTTMLRLIPARDAIDIVKREWTVLPHLKTYSLIGAFTLLMFLLGLLVISRFSVSNMATSLEKIHGQLSSQGGGGGAGFSSAPKPSSGPGNLGKRGNDIKFNDPIKTREVIGTRVDDIVEQGELVRLENFIILDKLGKEDPESLGALMALFPIDTQRELLSLSRGTHWMDAMTYPGELSMRCLEVVEELGRVKPSSYNKTWEQLLIQVWRMDTGATTFLKKLDFDNAMTILNAMPKFISVPLARETFPGNWAALLDPNYKSKRLSDEETKTLYESSLINKSLVSFDVLGVYKKLRELLSFLKVADVRSEKEVYEAVPHDSMLTMMRPPFYKIFEEEDAVLLMEFVESITVDDWSHVLFGVPRDQRRVVEQFFTSKEKFFYLEKLKAMDIDRPNADEAGEQRSIVAQNFSDYKEHYEAKKQQQASSEAQQGEAEDEDNKNHVA